MYLQRQLTGQQQIERDDQVKNDASGYVFALDKWEHLRRWIMIGSEGGTYYADEHSFTHRATHALDACLAEDGLRVIEKITQWSLEGRAPKQDQIIYALAKATSHKDIKVRQAAFAAMIPILRTASFMLSFRQLLSLMAGVDGGKSRGSSGLARAFAKWMAARTPDQLAYQFVKYAPRVRDNKLRKARRAQGLGQWTLRDLMRQIKPAKAAYKPIFAADPERYSAVRGYFAAEKPVLQPSVEYPQIIRDYDQVRGYTAYRDLDLARNLPHEAIPDHWRTDPQVWAAMLPKMGMTALLRNCSTMTRLGVFDDEDLVHFVVKRLTDAHQLRKARVHPINILTAWLVYKSGHSTSIKFDRTPRTVWTPHPRITAALEAAFYAAFGNIQPANARTLIGLDVSPSMTQPNLLSKREANRRVIDTGIPGLTPRLASAALSLMQYTSEPNCIITAFSSERYTTPGLTRMSVDAARGLDPFLRDIGALNFGGTDCALPMLYAIENDLLVDTFVIYTDNETWAGAVHPYRALQMYRQKSGIDAKLIAVAMTATEYSIGDPHDAGTLNVVGFDLLVPQHIATFSRRGDPVPVALAEEE
jgi:60 kDa SS-A/Ro ribonucleoprotein